MGCNCCRILSSCMFNPEEPQSNGYVNEAHSYTLSEHDISKSQTIKISERKNEDLKIIDHDRVTGSQDAYNVTEKTKVKNGEADSKGPTVYASPYPILHFNLNGEIKENTRSSREFDYPSIGNRLQSKNPPYQHGFDQDTNIELPSEEPECIQHEATQENNSLTESAMLDVQNDDLTFEHFDCTRNSYFSTVYSDHRYLQKSGGEPPQGYINEHRSSVSLTHSGPSMTPNEPSVVALMLLRNSTEGMKRNSTKKHFSKEIYPDDVVDADVAEALAALEAAIAGEMFEDD
ncbi:PDCD10 and GCKIII kinases-associated protein 1 isoform X1 [Ascaphus truei]|uniref:PDCD10 and GCKIII kinases-associated protein 1 isoform X1 n=1 Tax=Ascaphus truei TaxID=8439 RepID=UPI003F5A5193